jgi:tRNA nucleotidyltransferase (CCA-adding enzyme)
MGLNFLHKTEWIDLYPELAALDKTPQDKVWHPEGNAWVHTVLVCEAMADICVREHITGENRLVLMFAALCHDLGKPATTATNEQGRITSKGHCEIGVPIAEKFLLSIGCPQGIIDKVKPLVAEHLAHVRDDITPRTVRRLATRLFPATIVELCHLIEADMSGRTPLPKGQHASAIKLLSVAGENSILDNKPKPVIMGRHLLELGFAPGPAMGEIVKACYEAQLEGTITDEESGKQFVQAQFA